MEKLKDFLEGNPLLSKNLKKFPKIAEAIYSVLKDVPEGERTKFLEKFPVFCQKAGMLKQSEIRSNRKGIFTYNNLRESLKALDFEMSPFDANLINKIFRDFFIRTGEEKTLIIGKTLNKYIPSDLIDFFIEMNRIDFQKLFKEFLLQPYYVKELLILLIISNIMKSHSTSSKEKYTKQNLKELFSLNNLLPSPFPQIDRNRTSLSGNDPYFLYLTLRSMGINDSFYFFTYFTKNKKLGDFFRKNDIVKYDTSNNLIFFKPKDEYSKMAFAVEGVIQDEIKKLLQINSNGNLVKGFIKTQFLDDLLHGEGERPDEGLDPNKIPEDIKPILINEIIKQQEGEGLIIEYEGRYFLGSEDKAKEEIRAFDDKVIAILKEKLPNEIDLTVKEQKYSELVKKIDDVEVAIESSDKYKSIEEPEGKVKHKEELFKQFPMAQMEQMIHKSTERIMGKLDEIIGKLDEVIDNEDANALLGFLQKESPDKVLDRVVKNIQENSWPKEKINRFLEKIKLALEKKVDWSIALKKNWKEKLKAGLKGTFKVALNALTGGVAGKIIDEIYDLI